MLFDRKANLRHKNRVKAGSGQLAKAFGVGESFHGKKARNECLLSVDLDKPSLPPSSDFGAASGAMARQAARDVGGPGVATLDSKPEYGRIS